MLKVIENTVGFAVEEALSKLYSHGTWQERENQDKQDDCYECGICIDVLSPQEEPAISRAVYTDLKGLAKYDAEFLDGTADNAGWAYTYHSLYAPYYDMLIRELRRNPGSRRAVIALGQGDINFTADPPCLQLIQAQIMDEKFLELSVVFRSNDAVKAFPMNIHACSMLQKRIAEDLELWCGTLHYIALNFHCYNRDFKILKNYVKRFCNGTYEERFWSLDELEKANEKK